MCGSEYKYAKDSIPLQKLKIMNLITAILFFALSITAFELGNKARSLVSWLPGFGRLSGSHGFLP